MRAQAAPSNLPSDQSLHLEALPLPEFHLTPNPVRVSHRRSTEKVMEELYLEVQQGEFYIRHIRATGRSVRSVRYSKQLHQANSAFKKVILELNCNRLTDEPNVVKLDFELRDLSQPIEKQIEIQREIVPDPPKLFVPLPPVNLEVTQEREKTHTLTLQNRGEDTLTIKNIAVSDPSNLIRMLDVEYPIAIEGGGQHNVDMQLLAVDVEPGDHTINFMINSNCESDPRYQYVLNVKVNALEPYPHYLAIDFGTTNSCCAYFNSMTNAVELVHLDSRTEPLNVVGYDPNIIPSTIHYQSQSKNGKRLPCRI